ncbi:hypothetical protein FA13DRAFT_1717653 [Coprinellus micaceus]|uniref:Uncharacterized protein n=1 Tax=Coprinellus micaceus TaxID=71717 RepID=A0A4Y7SFT6_COPMI|nr:hypothetical protein FA13DRAFT_1717653 [Coprinellus micaceus]
MTSFCWMPPQLHWVYPQPYYLMQPPAGQQAPRLSCVNKKYTILRDVEGLWKFKTPLPELTGPNGLKEVYQRDFVAIVCHYFFTHVLPTPARCVPGVKWFSDCIARHRWYVQRPRLLHTQLVERDEQGKVTKRYEKRVHVWKPGEVPAGHNEAFYGALLVLHRVFGGSVKGLPWADSERGVKMHFVAAFTLAFGYCGDDEVSADHVRLTFFPKLELRDGDIDSLRKTLNEFEWRMFERVRFELLFLKNATAERFVEWVGGEVRGAVRVAGDPDGYKRNPDGWVRPPTVWEYVRQVRLRAGWSCNSLPPPPPPSSDKARPQSQALSTLGLFLDVQRSRPEGAHGTGSLSDLSRPQGHSHIWLRTGQCRWHPDYMGLYHPHFCDRCYPAGTLRGRWWSGLWALHLSSAFWGQWYVLPRTRIRQHGCKDAGMVSSSSAVVRHLDGATPFHTEEEWRFESKAERCVSGGEGRVDVQYEICIGVLD